MRIPYDLRLFLHPDYPEWVMVVGWVWLVLLLLLNFAIMVGRIQSGSDLPDPH